MSVTTKHPLYDSNVADWTQLRDTEAGQRAVKQKRFLYLPPTQGMVLDGCKTNAASKGAEAYEAYLTRASFPELVQHAVEKIVGVMHSKPAKIELPKKMEGMLLRATRDGESLQMLLRKINTEQILMGRVGILLDAPTVAISATFPLPYFSLYKTERIINWDDGRRADPDLPTSALNLVVLDESEPERTNQFEWEVVEKYRVCFIGSLDTNEPNGKFQVVVARSQEGTLTIDPAAAIIPVIDGNPTEELPFVFINTCDIVPAPDRSPMQALSNLALTIYRGDADYRQNLFMQGQDTLVTTGYTKEEPHRLGAGASIDLPVGGDAKFIGVSGVGLPEQREALQNDFQRAEVAAGELLDSGSSQKESGDALRVRVSSRSASLHQIALTGAFGLEAGLKMAARWLGLNPDEVKVTPNTEFSEEELTGQTLVELMTAINLGAPISRQSVHAMAHKKGLTTKTWEEELEAIEEEATIMALKPADSANPEDDPNDPANDPKAGAGKKKPPAKKQPPARK